MAEIRKLASACGVSNGAEVFTLNYDLCLEGALNHEHIGYTTGFKDGIWTAAEFERNTLHLYKLHGSFGWVRHPKTCVLYQRDSALQRDDIDILGPDTTDELIFGTDNKLQSIQPFLWMVHRFSEAIDRAKYVVTIGYGFADPYLNEMIAHTNWSVRIVT